MNDKNLHSKHLEEESTRFFSKGKIEWNKAEADIWAELAQNFEKQSVAQKVPVLSMVLKYAAAAVLLIVVGIGTLTFFYSKTVESLPGQHRLAMLPDGSTVELNAGSTLKYYPVKWHFERKLKFEGEGYFQVQKGEKFVVESTNGTTQVVGTSFNIYARSDQYRVTCLTGKVKVISNAEKSVTLEPNKHVELQKGELIIKSKRKPKEVINWKLGQFNFQGTPLDEVFDEIERQFAVTIHLEPKLNNRNAVLIFSNKYTVEEVLETICKTMQIKYIKQSGNVFLVVEKGDV